MFFRYRNDELLCFFDSVMTNYYVFLYQELKKIIGINNLIIEKIVNFSIVIEKSTVYFPL